MLARRRSYPNRMIRAGARQYIRANAWPLALIAGFTLGACALLGIPLDGYMAGLFTGILATAMLGAIALSFLLVSGQTFQVSGALGETNTADVLRATRRLKYIYGWIDGLEIEGGDIDHLVVTRASTSLTPNGAATGSTSRGYKPTRERRSCVPATPAAFFDPCTSNAQSSHRSWSSGVAISSMPTDSTDLTSSSSPEANSKTGFARGQQPGTPSTLRKPSRSLASLRRSSNECVHLSAIRCEAAPRKLPAYAAPSGTPRPTRAVRSAHNE